MLHCGAKMAAILPKSPLAFRSLPRRSNPVTSPRNLDRPSFDFSRKILPDSQFPCHSLVSPFVGFGGARHFSSGSWRASMESLPLRAVSAGGSGGSIGGDGGGNGGWGGESSGGGGVPEDDGGNGRLFLSWYLMSLDKHPVITKAITSALLTLIGDLICQILIDQASKLDLRRTFVFTFLGLALVGPTLHFWYLYLSKLVKLPGASGAFLCLLLDQFVFSPVFIGAFLSSVVALEGRPSLVKQKLKQEWFSAVLANWQLWIPFQFLNFQFVPQKFQVLAANFVALAWNVILSFKAHKEVVMK